MTGRPRFTPTRAQRERVKLLKAFGWSNERIAALIGPKGISRNTLEAAFAAELEFGADAKRLENMEAMEKAAKKGNASAGKWLAERFDAARASAHLDERAGLQAPAAPAPKEEPLGKKQLRQKAAERVTGKFAPPPPPATKH